MRRRGRRRGMVTLRIPRWLFSAIARLFGRARKRVVRRSRPRFSRRRFASHRGAFRRGARRFRSRVRSRRGRGFLDEIMAGDA